MFNNRLKNKKGAHSFFKSCHILKKLNTLLGILLHKRWKIYWSDLIHWRRRLLR